MTKAPSWGKQWENDVIGRETKSDHVWRLPIKLNGAVAQEMLCDTVLSFGLVLIPHSGLPFGDPFEGPIPLGHSFQGQPTQGARGVRVSHFTRENGIGLDFYYRVTEDRWKPLIDMRCYVTRAFYCPLDPPDQVMTQDVVKTQNYIRSWSRINFHTWLDEEALPFFAHFAAGERIGTNVIRQQGIIRNEYPGLTSTVIVFVQPNKSLVLDVNDIRAVFVLLDATFDYGNDNVGIFAPAFPSWVVGRKYADTAFVDHDLERLLMKSGAWLLSSATTMI